MKTASIAVLLACGLRAQVPSDAEIRAILAERIDKQHRNVGISVGVVDAKGRRHINYGTFGVNDERTVARDTIYEIGSVTKVFTSLILSDMVLKRELSLDDPVAKFLPPDVKVPERGGKKITLLDLATHSSGLPRMPTNFAPKDFANPYADYGPDNLYAFLTGYELTRDIGARYEYSNVAVGLLGTALSRRAGTDYETLVRTRVLAPLKMTSTAITLSAEMKQRLAVGHSAQRQPVANWDLTALAGAGALRSDVDDMLTFVAANLGLVDSPLASAMTAMLKTRRPGPSKELEIALGWHILTNGSIVWHNGGTGGYRSWIGFDPKTRVGVVLLSNMSTPIGVDDIGVHLLKPEEPLR